MNKMRELYFCLCNDIRGMNMIEDADLMGYRLTDRDTGETLYTAYVAQSGFSSYIATRDMDKGIDCANEKPLAEQVPLFTAVSKIKSDQIARGLGPLLYPIPKPVNWVGEWKHAI